MDKLHALFAEQTPCPFWGTNSILISGMTNFLMALNLTYPDNQHALHDGQTACPFWRTNNMSFLTNDMPFSSDKWCGTNSMPFSRDKSYDLFEGQMMWPFWGTNDVLILLTHNYILVCSVLLCDNVFGNQYLYNVHKMDQYTLHGINNKKVNYLINCTELSTCAPDMMNYFDHVDTNKQ